MNQFVILQHQNTEQVMDINLSHIVYAFEDEGHLVLKMTHSGPDEFMGPFIESLDDYRTKVKIAKGVSYDRSCSKV